MSVRAFRGDAPIRSIPFDDRGLAYGDGVFETLRVHHGGMPWWDAHWARLAAGAERLGFAPPDPGLVRREAAELFPDRGDGVLKILVTRGGAGRGYAPPVGAAPTWLVARHGLPPPSAGGLALHWCEMRLAIQPRLAGLKHCNRLEQVLARGECEAQGTDEGLMRDTDGHVVCATSANLFVLREGRWWTPPLDRCGVAGTCRAALWPSLEPLERRLSPDDVESAEAVFLCNAVRGILPVARLGGRRWPPHPRVAAARDALASVHPGFAGAGGIDREQA